MATIFDFYAWRPLTVSLLKVSRALWNQTLFTVPRISCIFMKPWRKSNSAVIWLNKYSKHMAFLQQNFFAIFNKTLCSTTEIKMLHLYHMYKIWTLPKYSQMTRNLILKSHIYLINTDRLNLKAQILYVMQHFERGTLQLWALLDMDEKFQKIIQKTTRIFDPFSIVKFEYR